MISDRERIARDLHDVVIQRLFATGLQLQGLRRWSASPEVAARIDQAVDELDLTIRDIRSTIFELQQPSGGLAARGDPRTWSRSTRPRSASRPRCAPAARSTPSCPSGAARPAPGGAARGGLQRRPARERAGQAEVEVDAWTAIG